MAKCNQLTYLPFKGLNLGSLESGSMTVYCRGVFVCVY